MEIAHLDTRYSELQGLKGQQGQFLQQLNDSSTVAFRQFDYQITSHF